MTRAEELHLLTTGAADMGLRLDAPHAETLLRLVDELEAGNAQFNLTAIRDRPGMLRKHVLDSLSLQPYLRGSRLADVGTGAGFPGPAAGHHQSGTPLLADRSHCQEGALRRTDGGASGPPQRGGRQQPCRDLPPLDLYDTVMARALSSLADFVAYAGHLCDSQGRLLAMKGKRPDDEMSALPKSFRVLAVHRLKLPGLDDERHLVEVLRARPGTALASADRPQSSGS